MDAVKNLKYQASNYTEDGKKGELGKRHSQKERLKGLWLES
jgi:hypothetical protein